MPDNRIADLDRRGVKWRKFNEINVVDINYKHTTYDGWQPVKSGLNGIVRLYSANAQKLTINKNNKFLGRSLFRAIPRDNKSHVMFYNVGFC